MSLLHLPNELISCISEYLGSTSDINNFAQSNRRLYRLVNSYLYRRNIQRSESSALIWAAQNGQLGTAQRLLEQHTNDEARKDCCVIPLFEAAGRGHEGVVRLLLDNGADIHARRDKAGKTAATSLTESPEDQLSPEERQRLALEGVHLDSPYDDDEWVATYTGNALYAAAEGGHTNIVKLLLDNGATVDTDMGRNGNAFQAAVDGGYEEVVKLLLDGGFDVHTRGRCYMDELGQFRDSNALCAAAEKGHTKLVKLLLEHGMAVNESGGVYGSPLQAAAAKGHEQIVEILLDTKDIDINAPEFYFFWQDELVETSPLYLASEEGHVNVVKLLLDRGADINARSAHWTTALTVASVSNQEEVVRLLIERGADLNVENEFCSGALEGAAQYGHEEIVELLFEAGADIEQALEGAEARKGRDPSDYSLQILTELIAAQSEA
jgi:ankyrin repeat protein